MRVAIIPARGGSRRVPRKNIRFFHGKPIIAYPIAAAQASGLFDQVIVSTDDQEIAAVAAEFGASSIPRAAEYAQDECGTQEVTRHAVESMRIPGGAVVCCLYPTSPLVLPPDFHLGIGLLTLRPASFVVSVGTQPLRDAGALYFGHASAFLERLPLWNTNSAVMPLPEERVCDINTEDDWRRAEQMYVALHP